MPILQSFNPDYLQIFSNLFSGIAGVVITLLVQSSFNKQSLKKTEIQLIKNIIFETSFNVRRLEEYIGRIEQIRKVTAGLQAPEYYYFNTAIVGIATTNLTYMSGKLYEILDDDYQHLMNLHYFAIEMSSALNLINAQLDIFNPTVMSDRQKLNRDIEWWDSKFKQHMANLNAIKIVLKNKLGKEEND